MNNKLSYLKSFLNLNTRRLTVFAIPVFLIAILTAVSSISGGCPGYAFGPAREC